MPHDCGLQPQAAAAPESEEVMQALGTNVEQANRLSPYGRLKLSPLAYEQVKAHFFDVDHISTGRTFHVNFGHDKVFPPVGHSAWTQALVHLRKISAVLLW